MATTLSPDDIREYELMVILPPDLTEPEMKAKLAEFHEALTQHGGKVIHQEVTPVRDFAYKIGKFDRGTYATYHFSFPIAEINELEKLVRIEMGIVRHMLITCPKNYEFKGIMEYEAEGEAMKLAEMEERKAKDNEAADRRNNPRPRPATTERPVTVPAAAANVSAEKPAPAPKAAPKADLNRVDEQLKAILDNPDISL